MSDVDHRAEMLGALDGAKLAATELMSARFLATAQVHATALVAEQQRISNVISMIGYAEELGHPDHDAENEHMWQNARKALGLS